MESSNKDKVKTFCEDINPTNIPLLATKVLAFIVNPAIYVFFCFLYILNYYFFWGILWW